MARKASSTLTPVLALVSMNGTPYSYNTSTLAGRREGPEPPLLYLGQPLALLLLHGPLSSHVGLLNIRDGGGGGEWGTGEWVRISLGCW